jgi:transposase
MHRPYSPEFRQQMVELVRSGRNPKQLAKEFEASEQTIRNSTSSGRAEVLSGMRSEYLATVACCSSRQRHTSER